MPLALKRDNFVHCYKPNSQQKMQVVSKGAGAQFLSSVISNPYFVVRKVLESILFSLFVVIIARSEDKLPIQHSNCSLILSNDIQLLMRNILRLLLSILLGTLASSAAAVALVIAHHRHRILRMDQT